MGERQPSRPAKEEPAERVEEFWPEHAGEACSEVPPESIEGRVDEACQALLAFGVDGAADIAAAYDGDDILAWLRYAKEKRDDLANPQGLVVRRLQQGRKPPPAYYEDPADWRRFTNGDYAGYLDTCPELAEATCPEPAEGDPA